MSDAGSCPCNGCPKIPGTVQPKYLNNMGVPNCDYPESFDCVNRLKWAQKINPQLSNDGFDIKVLNPKFGLVYAPEFFQVGKECQGNICDGNGGYTTFFDSRVKDPFRGITTILDRPPLQARDRGTYNNPDVYGKDYDKIRPQTYGDYSQINNGQLMYYYDQNEADPYFSPNFVRRTNVDYVLFKDPMGAIKPEYLRHPFNFTNNNLGADSYTKDTLDFREDIMERQMRVRNQQRYEPRYFSAK